MSRMSGMSAIKTLKLGSSLSLTAEDLFQIEETKRKREPRRKAAQAVARFHACAVPSSSAPPRIRSGNNSNLSPPKKRRTKRGTSPDPAPDPASIPQAETQDIEEWRLQWGRHRVLDQGVLLDSRSDEDEKPACDVGSLDLCK
jgi:nucleotidyltransferase/DNA polymerase involved in DNA repair